MYLFTDMSEHVRRISRHLRAMPNRDLIKVGTSLGLSTSRLRRMAPFPPDVVVSAWLNQEDDTVETSGLPTLQSLVTALRQYGQEDIANKIVEGQLMNSLYTLEAPSQRSCNFMGP